MAVCYQNFCSNESPSIHTQTTQTNPILFRTVTKPSHTDTLECTFLPPPTNDVIRGRQRSCIVLLIPLTISIFIALRAANLTFSKMPKVGADPTPKDGVGQAIVGVDKVFTRATVWVNVNPI